MKTTELKKTQTPQQLMDELYNTYESESPHKKDWRAVDKRHRTPLVLWDHTGPTGSDIRIAHIEHFDARGKRRVYDRADRFGKATLNMDVWRAKNGRLLARFWQRYESRHCEVDWDSYEIIGLSVSKRPDDAEVAKRGEHWVPQLLRDEYRNWVVSNMPFVY